jgi:hypothetical protein
LGPRNLRGLSDALDFLYLPSRDVAADLAHFTDSLGATVVELEARGAAVAGAPERLAGRRDF